MKTCPDCKRLYSDEEMIFCLADGTQLLNVKRSVDLDATWRLSPRVDEPAPTQVVPTMPATLTDESQRLSTTRYQPELQSAPVAPANTAEQRSQKYSSVAIRDRSRDGSIRCAGRLDLNPRPNREGLASQVPSPSPQATVDTKSIRSTPTSSQKSEKGDRTRTGSRRLNLRQTVQ